MAHVKSTSLPWRASIRFRLTAWYVASVALVLVGLGGSTYWMTSVALLRDIDATLAAASTDIVDQVRSSQNSAGDLGSEQPALIAPQLAHSVSNVSAASGSLFLRVYFLRDGRTAAVSPSLLRRPNILSSLPSPRAIGVGTTSSFAGPNEEDEVRLLTMREPGSPYAIQVATPWDPTEDFLTDVASIIAGACLLLLFVSAVGGWLIVGRSLRPIDKIVTEAEHLSADHLHPSLIAPQSMTDDEIGHLIAALNGLMARLHRSFTVQRQFTADASHELRTPITIMRGEIELALSRTRSEEEYRRVLVSSLEETERMSRIVDGLNFLARSDAMHESANLPRVLPIDMRGLCEELVGAYRQAATSRGLTLSAVYEAGDRDSLTVAGDGDWLRRAIANLLDNALAYTPEGGQVSITCGASEREVSVSVSDSGEGISAEHLPFIFERFYRADKARINDGGSGLGLAIVKSIVEAHSGAVQAASTVGAGATIEITLPRSA